MLTYEKPETDVLARPPRNPSKGNLLSSQQVLTSSADHLATWKLIFQAYGEPAFGCHLYLLSFVGIIGMQYTILSFTMAFWYCQRNGLYFSTMWLKFGNYTSDLSTDQQTQILNVASSIYFVNLVIMQMFNLVCTKLCDLSD